ncbi:MAG: hypothetical protein LBK82_03785, partial [Planctomycetaceae bacterium]|nr:hypothetical protein [Planctomycetaceae bacterium]
TCGVTTNRLLPERQDLIQQQVKILPFRQWLRWFVTAGQRPAVTKIKPYRAILLGFSDQFGK